MDDKCAPPPSYTDSAAAPQQYPGQTPYPPQSTQQPYMQEQPHQQAPSYYLQQQYSPYPPQDQKQPIGQYLAGQQYPQQYSVSNTTVVSQPGIVQQMPMHVESYTFLSWFACLFCCWPVGIAAIIKSSEVNSSLANGDYGRAQRASTDAKRYAIIAIGCGLIILPLLIVFNYNRVLSQTY